MMEWTREAADEVLRLFLARTGLKNTKTKLISFRQTAIFYLADHDASLRVYGPGEDPVRAERMVQLARHLAGQDFPAIRPHAAFADQPFDIANLRASLWHWIEADDPMPKTDEMLGRLLRQLHDLPGSNALRLESFDPVGKIRQRLKRLKSMQVIPASGLRALQAALARALDMGGELQESRLGIGLIHGDATPGNIVVSGGKAILIDLDSSALGAREWDLVPMAVASKRFSQSQERWLRFIDAYGIDEHGLPGLEAASLVKQLTMTCYLCLSAGMSAAIDNEIRNRLRMWEEWDLDGRWHSGFSVARPE